MDEEAQQRFIATDDDFIIIPSEEPVDLADLSGQYHG